MTEAIIILMNMRGGCTTVGDKVHALFRVTSRGHRTQVVLESMEARKHLARVLLHSRRSHE